MPHPALITISAIIAVFAILLIIIYASNRKFRSYPCYFNIIFTLTITADYLIRLIPSGSGTGKDDDKPKSISCHIQAFSLTLFDKLMLTLMTAYSFIAYLGSYQLQFYKSKEKSIFIASTIVSVIISSIPTILFYLQKISNRSEYCYVETKSEFKKILDSIVTGILGLLSLFFIIRLLMKIQQIKRDKQNEDEYENERKSLNVHFIRFISNFIINFVTFLYVILLINKKLPFDNFVKDLIYILLSLLVELFFTINSELIKEVKRIITCKKVEQIDLDNSYVSENLNEEYAE
jgi:hypothetical protein